MTVARTSDSDPINQSRQPVSFHRRGNRALLISKTAGARVDCTPDMARALSEGFVQPEVTTICRRKESTHSGQLLTEEPAWTFSPCRRPVQHIDSPVGVSLAVVSVDEQSYHVWSESQSEAEALLLLSHEPYVYAYSTQFARVIWDTSQGLVEHFPDIIVEMADGQRWILDVRPRELRSQAFLAKAYLTQQWCTSHGLKYGLVGRHPRDIIALHRMASHYRDTGPQVWAVSAQILDVLLASGPMAIRDAANRNRIAPREAMQAVLFLVGHGRVRIDTWSSIDDTCWIEPIDEQSPGLATLEVVTGLEIRPNEEAR